MLDVLLWGWALALSQGPSLSGEELFSRATIALREGQYAEAERGFREVLRREPQNLGALGNLGVLLSRQQRLGEAVRVYHQALRLAPGESGLALNLGLAYMRLDDAQSALPLFAKVASRPGPLKAQAQELHASCQLQLGQVEPAVANLELLAQQPSANAGVLHGLALGYLKLGKRDEAQVVFQRLLSQLPAVQASLLEAQVWYNAGIFDKALESLERTQRLDPTAPGLERELGKTWLSLRDNAKAAAALRNALARDGADLEARYFLGAMLVQEGQYAEAIPLLMEVRKLRSELWGTTYYLGKAQLGLGDARAALPLLREAARRAPQEAPVHYQLARALQNLGLRAEAAAAFKRVALLQKKQNATELIVMK